MGRLAAVLVAVLMLPVSVAHATPRTDGSRPAPASVTRLVVGVPSRTLNKIGIGDVYRYGPQTFGAFKLNGPPLISAGKPEVVTMNFAWCPHCAANSWALAIALSRFGTLTGLRLINTGTYYCTLAASPCSLAPQQCYPYTHGLSFFGTSFKSAYLSFAHIVLQDVHGHNLQHPSRKQFRSINQYDPGAGSAPALDMGGMVGFIGPGYDPGALHAKTWSQIAGSLADPHSKVARHVDGLANLYTAAMCKLTKGRPAAVCRSKGVLAAGARVGNLPTPPPPPPGAP